MSSQETDQKQLKHLMSEISERCYHAGWLERTEFVLWKAVVEGPINWGQGRVDEADIAALKRLADRTDGWIAWDESLEEMFVPMEQWLQIYSALPTTNGDN